MPTYDYKCGCCSTRFEVKRGFNENSIVLCPKCQGEAYKVFSPVPVIFKGSGFYITDSRGGNSNFISEPGEGKSEVEEKSDISKSEVGGKSENSKSEVVGKGED
jgi:putative FmdB family regulatory protein